MDKIYSRFRIKFPKITGKGMEPHKSFIIIVIITFIIAYTTAINIINSINPLIERKSKILARSTATKLSTEACSNTMQNFTYNDLCEIDKDTNENIKMMKLNVVNVNSITSKIALDLQKMINEENNSILNIRLGSFTGSKLLAGRGPNVKIRMTTDGSIDTSIKSEFKDAGINQTLHKIYVEITCKMSVITPYKDTDETVTSEILLAEAVIVGEIPETYYNLKGLQDSDTLNLID